MVINEWIAKNEQLLPLMEELKEAIEHLQRIREEYKGTIENYNPRTLQKITKQINRSLIQFDYINLAYDEDAHKYQKKYTEAFMPEILEGINNIYVEILNVIES
jgi:hypothetical protein